MDPATRRILAAILLISVLVRVAAAIFLGNQVTALPGTADQVSYHALALRVLGGHGFSFAERWWPVTAPDAPTAHWSFLYTGYLWLVYQVFGPNPLAARLLQALAAGLLHPLLAFGIGRLVFSRQVGLIAAAVTAAYAYFIYYSAALMTEAFYICAILASLLLAVRIRRSARGEMPGRASAGDLMLLGLAMGAAVLLRQVFLIVIPFLLLWLWWQHRRDTARVLVPAAVVVLLILPFTLYNLNRFDRFVLLNTNAGYAFFWSNHPIHGTRFMPILPPEAGSYQSLIPRELRDLDEAALDQELLRRGLGFVLDEPGRYLLLSASRIPAYFLFWPSPASGTLSNLARVSSFGLMLPFMIFGLVRSLRRPLAAEQALLVLFVSVYSLIHLLTWSLVRYRLPVDAVLVVFAAIGLQALLRWIGWRGSPST